MNGWLALGRRPGESILIGDDVEVAVVVIHKDKVEIAIRAPRRVKVLRSELADHGAAPLDYGLCPNCESSDVQRLGKIGDTFRLACGKCRSTWTGIRRRLAA